LQPLNRLQRTLISRSAPMEDVMDVCGTGVDFPKASGHGWLSFSLGEIACLFAAFRSVPLPRQSQIRSLVRQRRSVRQWFSETAEATRQHPAAVHRFGERRLVHDGATRHRRQTEVPTPGPRIRASSANRHTNQCNHAHTSGRRGVHDTLAGTFGHGPVVGASAKPRF
jgi:hypothetical protein